MFVLRLARATARVTLGQRRSLRLPYLVHNILPSAIRSSICALHASIILLYRSTRSALAQRSWLISFAFRLARRRRHCPSHDCYIVLCWLVFVDHVKLLLRHYTFFIFGVGDFSDLTILIQSTFASRCRRDVRAYALAWTSLVIVTTIAKITVALFAPTIRWLAHVLSYLHFVVSILLWWVSLLYFAGTILTLIVLCKVLFQMVHSIG